MTSQSTPISSSGATLCKSSATRANETAPQRLPVSRFVCGNVDRRKPLLVQWWYARFRSPADFPLKPVHVIVASGAGGPSDLQARLLAQKLSESLMRPFVIENCPGGGGTIGCGVAAKATPDGYTLCSIVPTLTYSPALHANLPLCSAGTSARASSTRLTSSTCSGPGTMQAPRPASSDQR